MFKIRQKLIAVLLVVIVISVVAPTIILNSETNKEVKIEYANTLKSHIESFLLYYNSSNLNSFEAAKKYGEATGLRVTLIDSKGVVIGESNISKDDLYTMDNHLQRPEIQIADSLNSGSITRYSETLKADFIYLAKKVELKEIKYIRIAQEMALVNILLEKRQLQQLSVIIAVFIGLLILAVLIDRWINTPIREVARVAKELEAGKLNSRINNIVGNDEISQLARIINDGAEKLETDISYLNKLSEVRSEFLINVTHELKTPIASISGYLETLLDGAIDDKEVNQSFIKRSLKNSKRLEALVTDLVDISRIETGELAMDFKVFDIIAILNEVVNDARHRTKNSEVDIKFKEQGSEQILVKGDPNRIRQVIDNLVSNAIRYTDKGEINILLNNIDQKYLIEISDTGLGIPAEAIERIFERFYRTDKARDRSKGGTGLGLSITKHIIEAHGSEIKVKSEEDKGSTFSFYLET